MQHIKENTKVGQKFQEGRWDFFVKILFPSFACGLFCEGVDI